MDVIANIVGLDGGLVLLIALVVIFGGSQLPKIARNVGSAGKEFRKAQEEAAHDEAAKGATRTTTPAPPAAVTAAPVVISPAPSDDKVTMSKTELEALLDERIKRDNATN